MKIFTFALILFFSAQSMALDLRVSEDFYDRHPELEKKAPKSLDELDEETMKEVPHDVYTLLKVPKLWTKKQWLLAIGIGLVAAGIHTQNERIREFFARHQGPEADAFAEISTNIPRAAVAGTTVFSYVAGYILKRPELRRAAILMAAALAVTEVIDETSKSIDAIGGENHRPVISSPVASMFTIASYLSGSTEEKVVKYVAYAAATLTGLSQLYQNQALASEVFLGAAFGYLVGSYFSKLYKGKRYLITPSVGMGKERSIGISLRTDF